MVDNPSLQYGRFSVVVSGSHELIEAGGGLVLNCRLERSMYIVAAGDSQTQTPFVVDRLSAGDQEPAIESSSLVE